MSIEVGSRVRIERDETKYPSKGTWPRFRDKTGTVVEINEDRKRPHLSEYAVCFGKVTKQNPETAKREYWWDPMQTYWFKFHEMATPASQRPLEPAYTIPAMHDPREVLTHV